MLLREINEGPRTRREYRERQRRASRKSNFMFAGAATMLLGTATTLCVASATGVSGDPAVLPAMAQEADESALADTTVAGVFTTDSLTQRGETREENESDTANASESGVTDENYTDAAGADEAEADYAESIDTSEAVGWDGEARYDQIKITTLSARNMTLPQGTLAADGIWNNSEVLLADPADIDVPESIDHPTGDVGNAYAYGQCTCWAYTRRHQLGLPVGSHFGNGGDWANSARALGYSVDNNPQVGDIMVFRRGQAFSSSRYGHVAIVEAIIDGKVVVSESNPHGRTPGRPTSRTFANIHDYEYIHY